MKIKILINYIIVSVCAFRDRQPILNNIIILIAQKTLHIEIINCVLIHIKLQYKNV